MNDYSDDLIESRNIIFRGAPGTGKSYLAKKIAADIISNGNFDDYTLLTNEQKKQVEFVQFHPSYDYSDFVEGLRPKTNDTDSMGFELQEGVFTKFVNRAQKNYDDSQKNMFSSSMKSIGVKFQKFLGSYSLQLTQNIGVLLEKCQPSILIYMTIQIKNSQFQTMFISLER